MLWTPKNDFNWSVDNFTGGGSFTARGVSCASNAAANTKASSVTAILAAIAEDCYELDINFASGSSSGASRTWLVDIYYDPAGGTNWKLMVPDLLVTGASAVLCGGVNYKFPIFVPAGSSIGARVQCSTGGQSIRVYVRLKGKPSRPDLILYGTKLEAIGIDAANTLGTVVTGGNNVMGAWSASMGVTSKENWWWQLGIGISNAALSNASGYCDVAADATSKYPLIEDLPYTTDTSERFGKYSIGLSGLPLRRVPAGIDIYGRVGETSGPNTGITIAAYGLG